MNIPRDAYAWTKVNQHDVNYMLGACRILREGEMRPNRTGVSAVSYFGHQIKYDLRSGFPLLTTKKINFDHVKNELFWFLKAGDRMNVNDLPEESQKLWRPWQKDETGDLGPIYGSMWRRWPRSGFNNYVFQPVNQIEDILHSLKHDPSDRRMVVSAWNPDVLAEQALPPCHVLFHLRAYPPFVDMAMYQRSADYAVGVPFNIASYSLLLLMLAKEAGLTARNFIHFIGDLHIYEDQIEMMKEQIVRVPRAAPTVKIADKPFWDLTADDVELIDYNPHPFINYPVAV